MAALSQATPRVDTKHVATPCPATPRGDTKHVATPCLANPTVAAAHLPARSAPVEVHGCQGCGACLLTCPEHAIRPVSGKTGPAMLVVLAGLCTGCGQCVEVCPVDAISFTSPTYGRAT